MTTKQERLACLLEELSNAIKALGAEIAEDEVAQEPPPVNIKPKHYPNVIKLVKNDGDPDQLRNLSKVLCTNAPPPEPREMPFSVQNRGPAVTDYDRTDSYYNNYNIPHNGAFVRKKEEKPEANCLLMALTPPPPEKKCCGIWKGVVPSYEKVEKKRK